MNFEFALGLIIGLILGVVIGVNCKFILRFFGVLNSYKVVVLSICGLGFYSYFYAEDALFIAYLVGFIVLNFVVTEFLVKKTFLNKDESGCIVLGFFADLLFGYEAINSYISGFSVGRIVMLFLCIIAVASLQVFAYKKGYERKFSPRRFD